MAAFATTVKFLEDGSGVALAALIDTYMETLDSTNDPVASITCGFNSMSGKYWAIIVTT